MNVNKVILVGRVTNNPDTRVTITGTKVTSFGLATNRIYMAGSEKKEETEFHNVVSFGKQAETLELYVKKGDELYLEGHLSTRTWGDEGAKKSKTEIIVENFQFGRKSEKTSEKKVEKDVSLDDF